ncbi:peptidase M75 [Dokdonia sinensis]|uniref:Peptidase M75 n=1 Tax=Dokdonia sinensis TaxID=2479847 RepID=A0A3M0FWM0_9FLAO|nr:imelysin family protein [Dokdonia sinensis]RMB56377.1 peptidase M75 [Dokdonia sinensis]
MKKVFGLLVVTLIMFACSESDDTGIMTDDEGGVNPPVGTFDRSAMLSNWADNIIIPSYVDFDTKIAALETAVAAFSADATTANLELVRSEWLTAYSTWQRVSMFEIGPAETVNLRLNVNIYPTNTTLIQDNIQNENYNLSLSSNRVAKGFPAIDYLLYGIAPTDEAIISKYEGSEADALRHQNYLSAVVGDIRLLSTDVLEQWQGDYRDIFVNNDGASATASTDRLVNDYIFYYEKFLRAGKMGIPGGVFSGTVESENIEALYAGNLSKQFFLEGLNATQDFFNGKAYNTNSTGESLNSYLEELNTVSDGVALNDIINNQFNTARTAVSNLRSFEEELAVNPPSDFLEAYNQVQRVVPLLKVDMVSAMSISIDFADADGD